MSQHVRRIAVVIVHYKTPGMLRDAVNSLLPELGPADEVLIVDNASGAEHVEQIRPLGQRPRVTVIESEKNLGFAGANNLALQRVLRDGGADYYLLLNPDTIIRPGAVATLLDFLRAHPQAAAVGPRLEDPDGTPQQSAFGFITPMGELLRGASIGVLNRVFKRYEVYGTIRDRAHRADWLAGACVLMRSSLIEAIGLLDDRFFMYFEEVDFFRRAALLENPTLETWYEPRAHVVHLVGRASGIVRGQAAQKPLPDYWFESRHLYFRKHFGYFGMLAANALWFIGHLLNVTRKLFTGVSHAHLAQRETRDLLRHSLRECLHPRSLT